jgi:hypothetical protein
LYSVVIFCVREDVARRGSMEVLKMDHLVPHQVDLPNILMGCVHNQWCVLIAQYIVLVPIAVDYGHCNRLGRASQGGGAWRS